jgi:hypothetical protein
MSSSSSTWEDPIFCQTNLPPISLYHLYIKVNKFTIQFLQISCFSYNTTI